jgi:hypothetical protein
VNNPLKLPLGFDGKPIPYWLYKLHGLNVQFTCEICGNATYWGRRAYETHFKESRHQHGMRCLKIPNTRAFAEVRFCFRLFPCPFFCVLELSHFSGMMESRTGHGRYSMTHTL